MEQPTAPVITSPMIAQDPQLPEVWDRSVPYPSPDTMPDLDIVTHISVERAVEGGYHYLHEPSIAFHRNRLFCCFANHPIHEANEHDEIIRGKTSDDRGMTWSPTRTWVSPTPQNGAESYNHPVLTVHQGRLWGFFCRWKDRWPSTEVFVYEDSSESWESTGTIVDGFIPFQPPMRMNNGNWIIGGERHWTEAAVMVSQGDDFTSWNAVIIPRPPEMILQFPEVALLDRGDSILALCRPHKNDVSSPMSISMDCGQTWTTLRFSNLPLGPSQPCAGRLSNGRHFLLTNSLEEKRALLTIAVTDPAGRLLNKVWKVRHQTTPRCRLLGIKSDGKPIIKGAAGRGTQWSYPSAVERDGNLYVAYTHGKEDCCLSIIPVRVLA